jgi:hypothetical protein
VAVAAEDFTEEADSAAGVALVYVGVALVSVEVA